jgi:hypothetical protein
MIVRQKEKKEGRREWNSYSHLNSTKRRIHKVELLTQEIVPLPKKMPPCLNNSYENPSRPSVPPSNSTRKQQLNAVLTLQGYFLHQD